MAKRFLLRLVGRIPFLFGLAFLVDFRTAEAVEPKVDFSRDIQPIFIKRCYECHGPDKQRSGLRPDHKTEAVKGGKSGKTLLIAGKSSESELIARVASQDPDEVMPAKGERLTPEQIAFLRAWVDQGATWPD